MITTLIICGVVFVVIPFVFQVIYNLKHYRPILAGIIFGKNGFAYDVDGYIGIGGVFGLGIKVLIYTESKLVDNGDGTEELHRERSYDFYLDIGLIKLRLFELPKYHSVLKDKKKIDWLKDTGRITDERYIACEFYDEWEEVRSGKIKRMI